MASILIASAHESVQKHFADVLRPDGHTFVMCENGDVVRAALHESLPDLIVADVDLPGLDAFELVDTLQKVQQGRSIPPIVMRSNAEGKKAQRFVWMDGDEGPEELRALVRARLVASGAGPRHGRVLVVDDDLNLRKSLEVRLKKEGYEVITAIDGQEAFAKLAEAEPDVVLTDVDMPRLDGFGLVQKMRAEEALREIPVIVMTAHATGSEEAASGLDLGANDYVRKPFDWRELTARVQAQIRVREASRLQAEKQRDLAIIELAGAAAHEINNPLAVIMARVELMLSDARDEKAREDLEQLDHLVHRVADVVKKMGQVRKYQVQHYCGGVNILDFEGASSDNTK